MDRSIRQEIPETLTDPVYIPAFLRGNMGKVMRCEFLIGTQTTDRVGRLIEVGASYFVLQGIDPFSTIMCDMFSLKFVTIVQNIGEGGIIVIP